jgi:hypothetical protein
MNKVRELWLFNPTTSDVSVSDIGVKVPAGKAVNVYQANPYLTTSKVQDSLESGAIARRLEAKVLRRVKKKPSSARPETVDMIKASRQSMVAKKTKTSVVLDSGMTEDDLGENGEFKFADYGVNDLPPINYVKNDVGAIVAEPKVDKVDDTNAGEQLVPKVETGINNRQSQIVMDTAEKSTHPAGTLADVSSTPDQHFIVNKPPVYDNQTEDGVVALDTIDIMKVATVKNDGESVVMEVEQDTTKKATKKKAKRKSKSK